MKHTFKVAAIVLLVIGIIIAVRVTGLGDQLTFDNFLARKAELRAFVDAHYWRAVLIYMPLYILIASLALPGSSFMSIAGGFLFGMAGVFYVNISATIGASLAFLGVRYVLGDWVQTKYAERLVKFNAEFEENGVNYILMARLLPVFPFFLVNILSGLTKVRLWKFALITSLGIIPGSTAYVFAGRSLETIGAGGSILNREIILALCFLALLSMVQVLFRKRKKRKDAR